MKAVVTGVAGFVGSTLAQRLVESGWTVRGIDCFLDYYPRAIKERNIAGLKNSPNFSMIEANLLQTDITSLLRGAEVVFHQAAQAGVRASWGEYFRTYTDNNVLATQRLLDGVRRSDSVKRVVYASSSSIYGDAESLPTQESTTPAPVSPYGVTKLAAEHLMRLYTTEFGIPTVSLRYFTVYGPRQRPDMAFHRFIKAGLKGETLTLYGDGLQSRDFTYIDDIVRANIAAVDHGHPGGVYNLGGGTQATVNEVLQIIEGIVGPLKIKREERQAGDAKHTSAATEAARRDLNFTPTVSLRDGLLQEAEWVRGAIAERLLE
jgi:nucleoside-diphosphate-sugar epimerase